MYRLISTRIIIKTKLHPAKITVIYVKIGCSGEKQTSEAVCVMAHEKMKVTDKKYAIITLLIYPYEKTRNINSSSELSSASITIFYSSISTFFSCTFYFRI
tara:strand:- start:453 stop:755 length:303 start_codon:yes stop_codon:yes gene_type:complete